MGVEMNFQTSFFLENQSNTTGGACDFGVVEFVCVFKTRFFF